MVTRAAARWWLAGFIDGEGCVYHRPGVRSSQVLIVTVCDKELRDYAAACFDALAIEYCLSDHAGPAGRPRRWVVVVQRADSFRRMAKLVPIQHLAKQRRLVAALAVCSRKRCAACGGHYDQRRPGCSRCRARHAYRRNHGIRYEAA